MAWTWDRYSQSAAWHRHETDPLDGFMVTVDRMFYASAMALAVAIVALLFG